jgi:hypothetical protein
VQEPVILRDGDEIMLGKRLRLRFEAAELAPAGDERTLDQVELGPGDKTFIPGSAAEGIPSDPEGKTISAFSATPDQTKPPEVDEESFLPSALENVLPPSAPEKSPTSEADVKTISAFPVDKPEDLGDDDKTFIPGAEQK